MLKTGICDLLNIEAPVIQAGMAGFTSPGLVAAVSNAGGLGSIGATGLSADDLKLHLARTRELTERPFAVNHTLSEPDEVAIAITLEARPTLISFALADPGDLVKRAHNAGVLVMHQVTTVQQGRQAADLGVDIVNAQGGEAGGFSGVVAGLTLVPQVVDAVSPIPVVASGGVADGRGLAAALVLGAQGVNMGSRFLASEEAPISDTWKQAIVEARSEDAKTFRVWNEIFPPLAGKYHTTPRALSSPYIEEWKNRPDDAKREAAQLQKEMVTAMEEGTWWELLPFAGQSAGLIREISPAAQIVRNIAAEAESILARAERLHA